MNWTWLLIAQQLSWTFLGWQTSFWPRPSSTWISFPKCPSLMAWCCLESIQRSRTICYQFQTLIAEIIICFFAFEIFQNQTEGFLLLNWFWNLNWPRWWSWNWNRNRQWILPRFKTKGNHYFYFILIFYYL